MKRENRMLVAAVALPLLVGIFFGQDDAYKLSTVRFIVLTAVIAAYNLLLFVRKAEWEHRKTVFACSGMSLFTMGLIQGVCFLRQTENLAESLVCGLGILLAAIVLGAFFVLLRSEKGITENVITVVLYAAFLIRVFYIVMNQAHLFQNDVAGFGPDDYGHFGYIYFLFTDGKLPDLNPMDYYELYQPPLHYAVSALFFKLLQFFGYPQEIWEELLQVLTLAYSCLIMVFIHKIAIRLKLSLTGRLAVICFAGFLPYSVMMSGSLNNDLLATLFTFMAVYFTLKWYDDPKIKTILVMALCIGCAMMSKVSAALIAPAMAILMLQRAWKNRESWKVYLKQFVCFGLIAFPLGLWHSTYNYFKYQMPFGYASPLGEDSEQFIGFHDKWSRFFDFDRAFEFLAVRAEGITDFADYNIPAALIKFATFGESQYYEASTLTDILGTCIFWATAVLFILMVLMFVVWCFLKDGRLMQKIFLFTGAAVSFYFYLKFCIKYTHVCTMNIRYVMSTVYINCLIIGAAVTSVQQALTAKNGAAGHICGKIVTILSVIYASAVIVLMAGMERLLY